MRHCRGCLHRVILSCVFCMCIVKIRRLCKLNKAQHAGTVAELLVERRCSDGSATLPGNTYPEGMSCAAGGWKQQGAEEECVGWHRWRRQHAGFWWWGKLRRLCKRLLAVAHGLQKGQRLRQPLCAPELRRVKGQQWISVGTPFKGCNSLSMLRSASGRQPSLA